MTIADLFVAVKFTPDKQQLVQATNEVKGKFKNVAENVSGISKGMKGLFALNVLTTAANAVGSIAGKFIAASQNAAMLDKMAKRAGKTVEQFQRDRGDATIMSQAEVDRLKTVGTIIQSVNSTLNKIMSGVLSAFMPIIDRISKAISEFAQSDKVTRIVQYIVDLVGKLYEMIEPIFQQAKNIFEVLKNNIKEFNKMFGSTFNSVKNIIRMVLNFIATMFVKLEPVRKAMTKVMNAVLFPLKMIIVLVEDILAIFDDDVDGYLEQSVKFKPLVEKVKAAKEWLFNFIETYAAFLEKVFENISKWIGILFKKFMEALNWIFDKSKAIHEFLFGKIDFGSQVISSDSEELDKMINKKERKIGAKEKIDDAGKIMRGVNPVNNVAPSSTVNNATNNNVVNRNNSSSTVNNNNITVNVNGNGDKAEIAKAVETSINKSRLQNATMVR